VTRSEDSTFTLCPASCRWMPHEIVIDSHHGTPHIHPQRKEGDPVDILARSMERVREIVYRHAERKQNVVYQELLEELR